MLEALHLKKVYKTKGGADVNALDDVSIRFPEKGMVFLLGRSGSGKSTLLNVCGGLDSPSEGEVIVKGRSSKSFSQSDFDSYRNTYVGFIFQEYNILNEFSVEDNIALALELQGKPKDKKVIAKLLEDVDLTGYAKRKPNTLSGGQKQRIAIARALVKSPEIIMADEPTGALDSATGTQVFDTLKKLSKDKLVIVVSHDRDFAEQYGDRIIELKDGKILSDITKSLEQQKSISENISVVGNTLCVKKGGELTDKEFEEIKNFLKETKEEIVIATGEKDVKTFKEVSHITENGEKEIFKDSDESTIEKRTYLPHESRFIRSKLPARHAFKIGVSGLKTKPFRLFFTILLCTVAFIFFGLLSTMTFYESEATFKQSLKDSVYTLVRMSKNYEVTEKWYMGGELEHEYSYGMETYFSEEELKEYGEMFGSDAFGGVNTWTQFNIQSTPSEYWSNQVKYFAYLDETNTLRATIQGEYPTRENEVCITSYMAEVIYNCKVMDKETGEVVELASMEDIIGKDLTIGGYTYRVVGILDSGSIPAKYDVIKDGESNNYQLLSGLQQELQDGLHQIAFVNQERLGEIAEENNYFTSMNDFTSHRVVISYSKDENDSYVFPEYGNAGYGAFSKYVPERGFVSLIAGKTQPAEDEVIVSRGMFYEIMMNYYENILKDKWESENPDSYDDIQKTYDMVWELMSGGTHIENPETYEMEFRPFTKEEMKAKEDVLFARLQKENVSPAIALRLFDNYDGMAIGQEKVVKVIGMWENGEDYEHQLLLSDSATDSLWEIQKSQLSQYSEYVTVYKEDSEAIYGTLFLPYDHSNETTNKLWDIYSTKEYKEDGSKSILNSSLISNLEMVDMMVETLSKVFLVVGIVLAVFAALLLSNFISVSISYKKKEIGILRAVGARSLDVFKIFFSESFTITVVCVVLSVVGSVICCSVVNGELIELLGASLFVFGGVSFVILVAVALVTVVIATFLPVWKAAKKKPVDSIRSL